MRLNNENFYLNSVVLVVILLSFIAALSFELYVPSLPMIAKTFNVSESIAKNTITATMVGYAIGSLIFGVFIDTFGRRKMLLPALFLFIIVSLAVPFVSSIMAVMILRFFQGMFVSSAAVCSRTLIADYFTGKRFMAVILYTSIASSLGLVLGPLLGGYLQYYFDWQSNFYAYAIIAGIIEIILLMFIRDSSTFNPSILSLKTIVEIFCQILSHKTFLASSGISSLIMVALLVYPTLGTFLVQEILGYSSVIYGQTALLLGLGYLLGAASSRFLLNSLSQKFQIFMGFGLILTAVILQIIFSVTIGLKLWTLVLPIVLINYSTGFIQGNVISICLKLFPRNVGTTAAIQAFCVMLWGSLGIYVVSSFKSVNLFDIAKIFLFLVISELIIFLIFIRRNID